MAFVLHEPKRIPQSKKNYVGANFKYVKNHKKIQINLTDDVVNSYLSKDAKKIKLFLDNERPNKVFIGLADNNDMNAYKLIVAKNTNIRKVICSWSGYFPKIEGKYPLKFEKFSNAGVNGLLLTLPE